MPRGQLAYITFIDQTDGGPVDPGYDRPSGGRPDQDLPGFGHPDQGLPSPGRPAHLPVYPFDPTRPDAGLPPMHGGGRPDNSLPGIRPGMKFIAIWAACQGGLILIPDQGLPTTPPPTGGQELPETPEPK